MSSSVFKEFTSTRRCRQIRAGAADDGANDGDDDDAEGGSDALADFIDGYYIGDNHADLESRGSMMIVRKDDGYAAVDQTCLHDLLCE